MNEVIVLNLKDELNPIRIFRRELDISVFFVNNPSDNCWMVEKNVDSQRQLLDKWIEYYGNEQHETILSVVDWYIKPLLSETEA